MAYVQGINAWIRLSLGILLSFFFLHGGLMWICGLMEEVLSQKRETRGTESMAASASSNVSVRKAVFYRYP